MGELFVAEIRGFHFYPPAKGLLGLLREGEVLRLEREPSNEYYPNALKVFVPSGPLLESADVLSKLERVLAGHGLTLDHFDFRPEWLLGYAANEVASHLAPKIDSGAVANATFLWDRGKPHVKVVLASTAVPA